MFLCQHLYHQLKHTHKILQCRHWPKYPKLIHELKTVTNLRTRTIDKIAGVRRSSISFEEKLQPQPQPQSQPQPQPQQQQQQQQQQQLQQQQKNVMFSVSVLSKIDDLGKRAEDLATFLKGHPQLLELMIKKQQQRL
jgi:hypothetical protein